MKTHSSLVVKQLVSVPFLSKAQHRPCSTVFDKIVPPPHHGLLLTVTAFIAVLAAPPHGLYRRPDLVRQAVPLAPQMVGHGGGVGAADPAALAPHAAAPLDDLVRLPVDQDLDPLRRVARACC